MDFLFNEESSYCCLSEHFTSKHIALLEDAMESSDKSNNKGGNGIAGMGVSANNSSISGAPGLGYSTGSKDNHGNKMEDTSDNWGTLTEEEKTKVSQVLSEMRNSSKTPFSSIDKIGTGSRAMNDAPTSSFYSSYN